MLIPSLSAFTRLRPLFNVFKIFCLQEAKKKKKRGWGGVDLHEFKTGKTQIFECDQQHPHTPERRPHHRTRNKY